MKAEIVSIGTELLLGEITDTNSSYLAGELPLLGIDLYWVTQVGDNRERLVEAFRRAWERSDLVILSGGLGPTDDDLTREAVAELFGEEMTVDPGLEEWLRGVFSRLGFEMPPRNIKQATLIPSARAIPNPRGTAPGWWVEREGKLLLALPGPPSEMQRMWEKEIAPQLREKLRGEVIVSRALWTAGLSEARVDEAVSSLSSSANPTLAVYAKPTGIKVRITAKAATAEQAQRMLAETEARVHSLLGDSIWGADEDTLEGVVGEMLKEKGLSLAVMESCTGGLLASMITDIPGASHYFKGGLVSYSNELKVSFGVAPALIEKHGVISPEVAADMARAARERLQADIGIGITGVAGPDEVEGKPVGTCHIAIDSEKGSRTYHGTMIPRRPEVKRRAALTALFELRRLLLDWK